MSPKSTSAVSSPRQVASRAAPQPVTPPPMIRRSNGSASRFQSALLSMGTANAKLSELAVGDGHVAVPEPEGLERGQRAPDRRLARSWPRERDGERRDRRLGAARDGARDGSRADAPHVQ